MVAQKFNDSDTAAFLAHMMRGGSVGMWWRLADRRSVWWPANRPDWSAAAGGVDVYYGVCPGDGSRRSGGERNTAESVAAVNAAWVDVDAKDYEGDMAAALAVVQQAPLQPSAIVNSGGGWHAYWLLAEPFQIGGDAARRAQIAGVLRRWVAAVGGDSVGDLPRILRLPGTINGKSGGRRAVTWHSLDLGRVYAVADIEAALAAVDVRQATLTAAQPRLAAVSSGQRLLASDDADRARRALRLLAAWRRDEYGEWVRVGMTMAEMGPVGLALWDDWSRGSARYEPGACEAKWRTFGSEGVGLGTLHTLAREDDPNGYAAEFGGGRLIAAGAASVSSGRMQRADTAAAVVLTLPQIARFETDLLPQFTAADTAALPRCFGDMVAAVAHSVQRPAQMPLWAGLGVMAAALAGRLRWQYPTFSGGVNLYTATVAAPGMRKSEILNIMRQPLESLQEAEYLAQAADVGLNQSMWRSDKLRQGRIEADLAAGKVRGDARLELESDLRDLAEKFAKVPTAPSLPLRYTSGDVTPERLAELLAEHLHLAVLSDEGQIFDAGRKYQSGKTVNVDVLLQAWDGNGFRVERKSGTIVVPKGATLSIGVMVQPARYGAWLSDAVITGQGLAQRFLIVSAEKGTVPDATRPESVPPQVARRYADFIRWCATAAMGTVVWRAGTAAEAILHAEQVSENARNVSDGFYAQYGQVAAEWGEKLFGSGTLRMAAILAAGYAYDAQEGADAATWRPETLERGARAAIALATLARAHTLRVMVDGDGGGLVREAGHLLRHYLLRHFSDGESFQRRDVLRHVGTRYKSETLEPLLAVLHDRGYLLLADDGKHLDARGRLLPGARLMVHPHAAGEPAATGNIGATFAQIAAATQPAQVPAVLAQIAEPVAVATQPAGAADDPRLFAWRPNAADPALADMWNPDTQEWEEAVNACDLVRDDVAGTNKALRAYLGIEEVLHAGDQASRQR